MPERVANSGDYSNWKETCQVLEQTAKLANFIFVTVGSLRVKRLPAGFLGALALI